MRGVSFKWRTLHAVTDFSQQLDDMEAVLEEVEALEDSVRDPVFALLDGIDALHRHALDRLAAQLDQETLDRLAAADPAVAWLFGAYGIGVDERATAEAALESIRPYLHSHGGDVTVVEAHSGVVRVRLSGACSGCTASTITLRRGVEEALRDGFPGFVEMVAEEDDALPHPPPGPTLLQIDSFPQAGAPPASDQQLIQIETYQPPPPR